MRAFRITTKRDVKKRFHRALTNLQQRTGWDAKELASHYGVPHRSVLNWLAGSVCPGPRRLRALCDVFGWEYDVMLRRPSLEDPSRPLTIRTLRQRHLSVHARCPLEALNYCSLAGALAFNDLSTSGFECRAILGSDFRTNILFKLPKLAKVFLRIDFEGGRGLVIRWLDEHQLVRETMPFSGSVMTFIKKKLRSLACG
jgi:hypothetical protein